MHRATGATINVVNRLSPHQLASLDGLNEARINGAGRGAVWRRPPGTGLVEPAVIGPEEAVSWARLEAVTDDVVEEVEAMGGELKLALSAESDWLGLAAQRALLSLGIDWEPVAVDDPRPRRFESLQVGGFDAVLTQWWLLDRLDWPPELSVIGFGRQHAGRDPQVAGRRSEAGPSSGGGDEGADRNRSWWSASAAIHRLLGTGDGDRLLSAVGFEHPMSPIEGPATLANGAAVVRPRQRRDGRIDWAWVVAAGRPTVLSLSMGNLADLFRNAPEVAALGATVRAVVVHPGLLSIGAAERLRALLPEAELFGVTIAPAGGQPIALASIDQIDGELRFVPAGVPVGSLDLFVVDDRGHRAPLWVPGRVLQRSTPGEGGEVGDERGANGEVKAMSTGLIGRVIPGPVLEVVGTEEHLIDVHGQSLNGAETLSALLVDDRILDAAIVPDRDGRNPVAWIVAGPEQQLEASELLAELRKRVSPYLLPADIRFVEDLPRRGDGWTDHAALAIPPEPTVAGGPDVEAGDPGSTGVTADRLERVERLAEEVLYLDRIDPDINLFDIGASSVDLVRLATRLEQELDLVVDVEAVMAFPSLRRMANSLQALVETERPTDGATTPGRAALLDVETISDPDERARFAERRSGLRRELADRPLELELTGPVGWRRSRRSVTTFSHRSVDAVDLASLLGSLASWSEDDGTTRYGYPSAGATYPVRVYVQVEHGRVKGLGGGLFYLDPARSGLVMIESEPPIDALAHNWINRNAFRSSAFSVLLVAHLPAIAPLYGPSAWEYVLVEAGTMVQLLQSVAHEVGLGLCPIAALDDTVLRSLLDLGSDDVLAHSLVGGIPEDPDRIP